MGTLVQAGASVVRSSGYYFNTGYSNGGLDITWEDVLNSDPMPPGLNAAEQKRVLGGEACAHYNLLRTNQLTATETACQCRLACT
jgi:hexosaminidase